MTRRTLCLVIALSSTLLSGCCWDRPLFWRFGSCCRGGCGEAGYQPLFPNLHRPFMFTGPAPMSMPTAGPVYADPNCPTCGGGGYPSPYSGYPSPYTGQPPVFTGPPSTALPPPNVEK